MGLNFEVSDHKDLWGPGPDIKLSFLSEFPLETMQKAEKIGRVCDFSQHGLRMRDSRQHQEEEEAFQLVDTRVNANQARSRGFGGIGGRGRGRFGFGRGRHAMGRGGLAMLKTDDRFGQQAGAQAQQPNHRQARLTAMAGGARGKQFQFNRGKGKGKGRGFGRYGNQWNAFSKGLKDWSVQTKPDWITKFEIPLASLAKLNQKDVESTDITWCGSMCSYDKTFDRLTPKQERPLARFEGVNFYNVTSSEDPILMHQLQNSDINVIATDQILSVLMTAGRSIYSWDIVITKLEGRILLFDKRDGGATDYLTVNENAVPPPSNEDKESVNAPTKLGQEASCIYQNFSQVVLDHNQHHKMENVNPFEEVDDSAPAASGAYRYRQFILKGDERADDDTVAQMDMKIAVRCEVDSMLPGTQADPQYVSLCALHEYDPKVTGWRKALDTQRGAVLATEMKNNATKFARWTVQAMLAEVQVFKLGYVSRVNPKEPWAHSLLAVHTHKTEEFARDFNIRSSNAWGIVRSIVNMVMEMDNGKYLLLKDPNKPVIRLYSVPFEEFENDVSDMEM